MKKYLYPIALATLSIAALPVFGLLYTVATAPEAHAGAPRPSVPPNPVTPDMQSALTSEVNAFTSCLGSRIFDVRADIAAMEAANNAAGWAAVNHDLDEFNAQAAIVRTELARLKPKYGC